MSFIPTVRGLLAVPLLAAVCMTSAQTSAQTSPATASDPLDARAPVPRLAWRSALQDYRGLRDEPPLPWRQANDAVRDIGGWRVYAREGQAAAPAAASAASAPAPQPARKP